MLVRGEQGRIDDIKKAREEATRKKAEAEAAKKSVQISSEPEPNKSNPAIGSLHRAQLGWLAFTENAANAQGAKNAEGTSQTVVAGTKSPNTSGSAVVAAPKASV